MKKHVLDLDTPNKEGEYYIVEVYSYKSAKRNESDLGNPESILKKSMMMYKITVARVVRSKSGLTALRTNFPFYIPQDQAIGFEKNGGVPELGDLVTLNVVTGIKDEKPYKCIKGITKVE